MISREQFEEWMAFGYIEGWYPIKQESKRITPDNFEQMMNK